MKWIRWLIAMGLGVTAVAACEQGPHNGTLREPGLTSIPAVVPVAQSPDEIERERAAFHRAAREFSSERDAFAHRAAQRLDQLDVRAALLRSDLDAHWNELPVDVRSRARRLLDEIEVDRAAARFTYDSAVEGPAARWAQLESEALEMLDELDETLDQLGAVYQSGLRGAPASYEVIAAQ